MEAIWNYLHELNWITVILRILFAAFAGGIIGVERGLHGRAAGMRTHMMVCLGATLTTLLGVYNVEVLGVVWADPMRVGAQVISGVGFLGAGTILLKKGSSQIRGLTTAAGLWATAVIGLAIGVGFYLAAFVTMLVILLTFTVVSTLEFRMSAKRQRLFVYLELDGVDAVTSVIEKVKNSYGGIEIQITPPRSATAGNVGLEALIRVPRKHTVEERMQDLHNIEHVIFAILAT